MEAPDSQIPPIPEDSQVFPDSQVVLDDPEFDGQLPKEIPDPDPIAPPPKAVMDVMDTPILSQEPPPSQPSQVVVLDSPAVKLSKAERIAKLKAQLAALEDKMGSLTLELGNPILNLYRC